MKSKGLTIFLLVVVALLWGTIVYKVLLSKENAPVLTEILESRKSNSTYILDTFSLNLNYSDPFAINNGIRENVISKNIITPPKTNSKQHIQLTKPVVNWPEIIYFGNIRNQKTKKERFILKINNYDKAMAVGDSFQGVKLISFSGDSIKISFEKHIKYLKKYRN